MAGVDAGLFAKLNLMEQYSAAAYCPWNSDSPQSAAVTCDDDLCPEVQGAGASTIVEFAKYVLEHISAVSAAMA